MLCRIHSFDRVHNEVQNDLLQLDLVTEDRRKVFGKARLCLDAMRPQVDIDKS